MNPIRKADIQKIVSTSDKQFSNNTLASAPTGFDCLFGGPIYGGTFNINITRLQSTPTPPTPPPQSTKQNKNKYHRKSYRHDRMQNE